MRSLWPTILSEKSNKSAAKSFLLEFFNIRPCYLGSMAARRVPARIVNEVVKAMNEEWYLPRLVIIMLDKDLIDEANCKGFGCKTIFDLELAYMTQKINEAIELRRDDLRFRCAGSVMEDEETTVVWIEMPTRPFMKTDKGFVFAQRSTFNKCQKAFTAKYHNMRCINLHLSEDRSMFDLTGHLTSDGRKSFWKELNRSIHRLVNEEKITNAEEILRKANPQEQDSRLYTPGNNQLLSPAHLSLEKAFHAFKRH